MGSAGAPAGGFDMQKFFKPGSPANAVMPPPSAPYPPSQYPPNSTYSAASFSFPAQQQQQQQQQYLHHYNPNPSPPNPRPYTGLQNQSVFPQPTIPPLPSPIASPPLDGARLMALLTAHNSDNNNGNNSNLPLPLSLPLPLPSNLELPPAALSAPHSHMAANSVAPPALAPAIPTAPPQPPPSRLPSGKLPRGRHLVGEHVVYDIDYHLPGEAQPQLEVSPITNYSSDPLLVVGRQIAVNQTYICYGLRAGTIRILNINTALRALLRGHSQRVTDMAFFSEDVHLLASASSDGKIFIRKIVEGFGDDEKIQITEQTLLAIQIAGDWESVHPRLCWHSHQQDVLVVGIGKYVLKIDIVKARSATRGGGGASEEPVKFNVDNPVEGVYCMGKHDGDVTDLSISQWTRWVSASKDGTVQIWGDKKILPLATFKPHDAQSVSSVAFLTVPRRSDHIVLLTAGPLNRQLKLWVSASSDSMLMSSDSEKWQCIQTLDLKSSSERHENAFFNQVLVLPRANLILLANAKRHAIYAVHMDFGSNPAATRMDYLAEFSVTMPILSLTATSDNAADGEGIVQVYCVQPQAIQQYALDLSLCVPLPPPVELVASEKEISTTRMFEVSPSSAFTPVEPSHGNSAVHTTASDPQAKSPGALNVTEKALMSRSPVLVSNMDASNIHDPLAMSGVDATYGISMPPAIRTDSAPLSSQVPVPLSPSFHGRQQPPKSPSRTIEQGVVPVSSAGDQEYTTRPDMTSFETITTNRKVDDSFKKDDEKLGQNQPSTTMNTTISIESQISSNPTHLVTPSQLMSLAMPSLDKKEIKKGDNKHEDANVNKVNENMKPETKDAAITSLHQPEELGLYKQVENTSILIDTKEKVFATQASENCSENARQADSLSAEVQNIRENQSGGDGEIFKEREQPSDNIQGNTEMTVSGPSSTSVSPFTSAGSSDGEPSSTTSIPSIEAVSSQVSAMQDALNQLIALQKDLQNKMSMMVSIPVTKEGKRLEAVLGQRIEKVMKAHTDAMLARFQEENAKREKAEREHVQQMTSLSNAINKDLPTIFERVLKKEFSSLGPNVARMVTPSLEKAISTAINDAFQKGISDKALTQLEKSVGSKLDSLVTRQIQSQFQSSGKQALQEALRTSFETSIIPAFERSSRAMFEQVDAAFQKGMAEHTASVQQQFAGSHSGLACTLQDTVASASSLAQALKGELADGQRRLLALAEGAGTSSTRLPTLNTKQGNGGLIGLPDKAISLKHLEETLDPTKELSRLVGECKFEEAFHKALQMSDVSIVSWLCSQVDPHSLLSTIPLPLSQGVLLALVQQLGCDLSKDMARKLIWIREAALALNPNDHLLAPHMRPILEQLYQNLHRQMIVTSPAETSSLRLLLHVVNSILTACK
ncbi:hypothetical protein SUGI_0084840 [Cryptomeria japonica]|uniref:enhancer of mRNA-decapping protein 4 isoform X2 n=1 Tax=Cryptomeria japonica TaxID=3369 RepID=UPI002408D003|nr:enhancer of mRNA-decapping protein 4 isoform X2 [Cryptomeria japonica]GLJ08252.1 hypothetical protein SUGI_0084840 [Cryptomeria japonica]